MMDDIDGTAGFFQWLERAKRRRESAARLAAAREALNRVDPHEFYACCPCCNGKGVLAVIFGAKDDEVRG